MCMACNEVTHEVDNPHRLPTTVVPKHYAITLRPDLDTFTFVGAEVIDITVKKASAQIAINAVDLQVTGAYITNSKGSRLDAQVVVDADHEQVVLKFDGKVGRGSWQLSLNFSGEINDKLHGFYRSFYKDAAGKQHVIASTQFEPGDARRAFPCFDEPSFKATYATTLVVDPHLTAIANGAVVSEQLVEESKEICVDYGNGLKYVVVPARHKKVVSFKTTYKMSTYLVAWVIGEFEASQTVKVNGLPCRIFCPPGKKHLTAVALKATQFAVAFYESYFGIRYPGSKLDQIAIPNFAFGAMENADCITYRETALLVSDQTATVSEIQRVIEVVAHEIAHQWFGNLVTMKWWNDLWLNEAFATFMAAKVVDAYRKDLDRWTSFGLERGAAMRVDGLLSSRAVEAPVPSAAAAQGAFDAITYRKGASVLRMLEQFIGENAFRRGVASYLNKHAHGNTVGNDLWSALSGSSQLPVQQIMQSWVYQAGHPLITVSEGDVDGSITLSQRVFKYLSDQGDASLTWNVPVKLRYKVQDGVQEQWVLLSNGEQSIYLGEGLEWVVANAGGHGFYRTMYSPQLSAKLTVDVQNSLSAIERFNLVNDAWACTQAGLQGTSQYLAMVRLFGAETDSNVWSVIASSLSRLHGLLPEGNRPVFERLVRDLAAPSMARLGWHVSDSDSIQDRQLRGTIIALLGTTGGDTEVQSKADELFTAYKTNKQACAPDVVPAVVSLVAHTGDRADFEQFRQLHATTNVPQEQVRYLMALTRFQDEQLLEAGLNALTDGTIKSQDAASLTMSFLSNPAIAERAWKFVKENWDYIVKTYPSNGLITMVSGVVALDSPELEQDVKAFFAEHPVKGGDKAVSQSLEMLHVGVLFRQRETDSLIQQFASA